MPGKIMGYHTLRINGHPKPEYRCLMAQERADSQKRALVQFRTGKLKTVFHEFVKRLAA